MQGLKRAMRARAFACAAATFATGLAVPALAADAEPWPPSTAPGAGDSGDGNGAGSATAKASAPAPAAPAEPAAPVVEVAPVPHEVAPPAPAADGSPAPPPEVEKQTAAFDVVKSSSAPDAGVAFVSSGPARPSGVELGSRDGQFFLRTRGNGIVLLPAARLEIDGFDLMTPDQYTSGQLLLINRVRFDLAGWLGSKVYFNLSADFAYDVSLRRADNYFAVAPWGDRVILQVGQFDAPFTLENRTPDRYLDFFDRGVAVRAFAIPENKDQGIMIHGANPARNFYYSAAAMNGEGPAVTGFSGHVDLMARAWVAPFSFRARGALADVTVGASAWTGNRSGDLGLQNQSTESSYVFLTPTLWWMSGRMDRLSLRQQGRLEAGAVEINAPLTHRLGARFEWIAKRQPLAAFDDSATRPTSVGGLTLSGWAGYAEIWGWVIGSDRLLGSVAAPGLQLPLRYSDLRDVHERGGLVLSARIDRIDETLTSSAATMTSGVGVGSGGETKLTAFTLGGSYWYTRRARLMVNYTLNRFEGETPWLNGLGGTKEQEVVGRLALAL
jgi:hypothetical protein